MQAAHVGNAYALWNYIYTGTNRVTFRISLAARRHSISDRERPSGTAQRDEATHNSLKSSVVSLGVPEWPQGAKWPLGKDRLKTSRLRSRSAEWSPKYEYGITRLRSYGSISQCPSPSSPPCVFVTLSPSVSSTLTLVSTLSRNKIVRVIFS